MNRPGIMANPPAMRAPIIVPVMNAACLRTFPRRIETTAITMEKIVHIVSRCIQLNAPSLSSRIQKDETVT